MIKKIFSSLAVLSLIAGLFAVNTASAVDPTWDLTGTYVADFEYLGTNYAHDVNLTQDSSGNLTGNGGSPSGANTYTWVIDSGNVSGSNFTFTAHYTATPDAVTPLTIMTVTGSVGGDGSLNGTWNDNFQGGSRSGAFMTTSGTATEIDDASTITVVVTGDTAAGENQPGWLFNRDASTSTPFEFNTDAASIGTGSLYVQPIGANASDKFIAENFLNEPIADVETISYDFLIGSGGDSTDAGQFYMNVYANFGSSPDNKFYDCRYNVVPSTGSTLDFTTVTFDPTQSYAVTTSGTSPYPCPAIPADMDDSSAGSTIRAFAINVGDTSASDLGLDGYLDNVVVALTGSTTIYDFEPVAEPETVTVTIVKYIDGQMATATTAESSSFPMTASWDAENIGAGSGSYALGTVGYNSASPYTAVTSEMTEGADYSTSETTGGSVVAASCSTGTQPFALEGYKTGANLADAQAATLTTTAPSFTDLQDDMFVIVSNVSCDDGPPVNVPTNKEQCKNGGYVNYTDAQGNPFRNQGQCVSYINGRR